MTNRISVKQNNLCALVGNTRNSSPKITTKNELYRVKKKLYRPNKTEKFITSKRLKKKKI